MDESLVAGNISYLLLDIITHCSQEMIASVKKISYIDGLVNPK